MPRPDTSIFSLQEKAESEKIARSDMQKVVIARVSRRLEINAYA